MHLLILLWAAQQHHFRWEQTFYPSSLWWPIQQHRIPFWKEKYWTEIKEEISSFAGPMLFNNCLTKTIKKYRILNWIKTTYNPQLLLTTFVFKLPVAQFFPTFPSPLLLILLSTQHKSSLWKAGFVLKWRDRAPPNIPTTHKIALQKRELISQYSFRKYVVLRSTQGVLNFFPPSHFSPPHYCVFGCDRKYTFRLCTQSSSSIAPSFTTPFDCNVHKNTIMGKSFLETQGSFMSL